MCLTSKENQGLVHAEEHFFGFSEREDQENWLARASLLFLLYKENIIHSFSAVKRRGHVVGKKDPMMCLPW